MISAIDPARHGHLVTWCAVWNTIRPDRGRTPVELRAEIDRDPRTALWLAVDEGGRPAGAIRLSDSRWTGPDDPVEVVAAVVPGQGAALEPALDAAVEQARTWNCGSLSVMCTDDRGDSALGDLLRRRRFERRERDVEAVLDVASARTYDPHPPADVEFTTLARRPTLHASAHRCFELADADEPSTAAGAARPLADWLQEFDAPWSRTDDCLIAVRGDEVVGWANLERFAHEPRSGWNGFTGTHPDHRGRGIAAELKLRLVAHARELGIARLRTENHEDNTAIRHINSRIGYTPTRIIEWWTRAV